MLFLTVVLLYCTSALLCVDASHQGDEIHGAAGTFFTFTDQGVSRLDPVTQTHESIAIPDAWAQATYAWGDAVYMRDTAEIRHYIFVNEKSVSRVWVFDVDANELISVIDTGDNPGHIYGIPALNEVWTHADDDGTFDIINMNEVTALTHSKVRAHITVPGHGKLLSDPNLERIGFATNTEEGVVLMLDLSSKEVISHVNLTMPVLVTSTSATREHYTPVGTRGIAFSPVNDGLYVECVDPDDCVTPYTDESTCTGSIWELDAATLQVGSRLTSPTLASLYGEGFGLKGQPYQTPDQDHLIVTNTKHNLVHFLKPQQPTADNGATGTDAENLITLIVEVAVNFNPGKVEFVPKTPGLWGPLTSLEDYYVIVALEAATADSGIARIDLAEVSAVFNGLMSSNDVSVTYLSVGEGAMDRPMAAGASYIALPTGATSLFGSYSALALLDVSANSFKEVFRLSSDTIGSPVQVVWVPVHQDELMYEVGALESGAAGVNGSDDDMPEGVAAAALVLAVVCLLTLMVTCCMMKRLRRQLQILELTSAVVNITAQDKEEASSAGYRSNNSSSNHVDSGTSSSSSRRPTMVVVGGGQKGGKDRDLLGLGGYEHEETADGHRVTVVNVSPHDHFQSVLM